VDELLHSRIEQLKKIEERLDAIDKSLAMGQSVITAVRFLIFDLRDMIAAAEREHAEF